MAFMPYAALAFGLLIVVLQAYKWLRIHQTISSREPTPPSLWTLTLWPWLAAFLFFGVVLVWVSLRRSFGTIARLAKQTNVAFSNQPATSLSTPVDKLVEKPGFRPS